jgi:hypothetical protein
MLFSFPIIISSVIKVYGITLYLKFCFQDTSATEKFIYNKVDESYTTMEKRKLQVILLLFLLFLLSSQMVHAELIPKSINNALQSIFGATSANVSPIYIQRFIIWVLMFAILFYGAGMLFKEHKHITIAVAGTISLICALFIPASVLTAAFNVFGNFTGLILFAIPTVTILFLASKMPKTAFGFGVRALIFALATYFMGILLHSLGGEILSQDVFVSGFSLTDIVELGIFIFTILAIWNLIKAFTHGTSAAMASTDAMDNVASAIRKPGNALKQMFPKTAEIGQEIKEDKFQKNVTDKLSKITSEGEADSRQILSDLETIKKVKGKYGTDPNAQQELVRAVDDIVRREHKIKGLLAGVKELLRSDWLVNSDELKRKIAQFKKIEGAKGELGNSPEFKELEKLAAIDKKEEAVERRDIQILSQLEYQVEDHNRKFEMFLREALELIRQGRIKEADTPIDRAISEEKTRENLFKQMERYERILRRLERIEIKIEKKEEKEIHSDHPI